MTICIAAICEHKKKSRIVLCHDWQGTYDAIGSSDSFDKQKYLGKNWMALVSGDLSKADELCAILYRQLDQDVLDENGALKIVREGVFEFKRRLIDQFLQGKQGIDYETLCNSGKDIYPESVLEQLHRDVADVDLGVDMIVTGFVESDDYVSHEKFLEPCVIRVLGSNNQPLDVALHKPFACIGEGGTAALTSLLYRQHSAEWGLKKAAYAVYEAKKLAETLPSVGGSTSLYVQSEDEPLRYVSTKGFNKCEKMLSVFAPKKMTASAMKRFDFSLEDFELDIDPPKKAGRTPRPQEEPSQPEGDAPPTDATS